ncbi:MAG: N-acetyltransferase family protein [Fibrobacterota bacterium]
MTIIYKKATSEDGQSLNRYFQKLYRENIPHVLHKSGPILSREAEFIRNHSGRAGALFIAQDGNTIAGISSLRRYTHHQLDHCAFVTLSVLKEYRRQGIGRALMEEVISWARQEQLHRIELSVITDNRSAVRVYERVGFQAEGIKRDKVRIGSTYHDIMLMALLLTEQK